MKVYEVKITEMVKGMRIEGFNCHSKLFKTYKEALEYAYDVAKKENTYEKVEYNDLGKYCFGINTEEAWDWPEYYCEVNKVNLELDKDNIFTTYFSDQI